MSTLNFLYETKLGRVLLRPLISKPISDFSGFLLDSKISKALIRSFAKNNNIKLEDYILDDIGSFNDFFCRRIKPELRPVDLEANHLITPCDGLLKVISIKNGEVFPIKQSIFTINDVVFGLFTT